MSRYRYTLATSLAVANLCVAGYIAWDARHATSEELGARRRNVFQAFHRERVDVIEVDHASGHFTFRKRGDDWVVVSGRVARPADPVEVERLLSELEGAEAGRTLGALDDATRARFGLDAPRVKATVMERGEVTARFELGGAVEREAAVYVNASARQGARDESHNVLVLPRSFAEVWDRAATEFRDRAVGELDVSRMSALEITRPDGRLVLTRHEGVWALSDPPSGRASRGAVEAVTSQLRELRATRVIADDADDATLLRDGLTAPTVRLVIRRGSIEPVTLAFGGACPQHDGEVAATREGTRTVVCFPQSFVDALRVPATGFADDHVLSARTDEVERVRITGALPGGAALVLVHGASGWSAEHDAAPVDTEAVESWLAALHDVTAAERIAGDTRAAHGLSTPSVTVEVSRSGSEGPERILVGTVDATGLYASRDDEGTVLRFAPSAAEVLRVDAVRFRPKRVVHDAEGDLRALLLDVGPMHEEIVRAEGVQWAMTRPIVTQADPGLVLELAHTLADLEADRWVTRTPLPEHGLSSPRVRLVARFEGPGAAEGRDGGVAPVRTYGLSVGADAPGGGAFATLDGTDGVFVLPRTVLEALRSPHVERSLAKIPREGLASLTITTTGASGRRLALVREGERWRTDTGTPVDGERMEALLAQLDGITAPRLFGYGPAPAESGIATPTAVLEARYAGDAGEATRRVVIGQRFGSGEGAGWYARRDGVDATLAIQDGVMEAITGFRP